MSKKKTNLGPLPSFKFPIPRIDIIVYNFFTELHSKLDELTLSFTTAVFFLCFCFWIQFSTKQNESNPFYFEAVLLGVCLQLTGFRSSLLHDYTASVASDALAELSQTAVPLT